VKIFAGKTSHTSLKGVNEFVSVQEVSTKMFWALVGFMKTGTVKAQLSLGGVN